MRKSHACKLYTAEEGHVIYRHQVLSRTITVVVVSLLIFVSGPHCLHNINILTRQMTNSDLIYYRRIGDGKIIH